MTFKAFDIGAYKDMEEFMVYIKEQLEDGINEKNICVCIGRNNKENIQAQKEMLNDMF